MAAFEINCPVDRRVAIIVIASEAKQSRTQEKDWIASSLSLLAMTEEARSLLRVVGNDVGVSAKKERPA
jgi:hypothetical protein